MLSSDLWNYSFNTMLLWFILKSINTSHIMSSRTTSVDCTTINFSDILRWCTLICHVLSPLDLLIVPQSLLSYPHNVSKPCGDPKKHRIPLSMKLPHHSGYNFYECTQETLFSFQGLGTQFCKGLGYNKLLFGGFHRNWRMSAVRIAGTSVLDLREANMMPIVHRAWQS